MIKIRDCLRESEREARRQESGLRVRLHLDGASSDLPWEFLFDEGRQSFLSLSRMTPVVRYLEIDDVPTALKLDPPLRVLGVVSSPKDYPPLDVEGEWARLQGALSAQVNAGVVEVSLLPTATVDELLQALQRGTYHVLHFIGHGGFRESSDEGVLLFEDDLGGSHEVTGEELGSSCRIIRACGSWSSMHAKVHALAWEILLRNGAELGASKDPGRRRDAVRDHGHSCP